MRGENIGCPSASASPRLPSPTSLARAASSSTCSLACATSSAGFVRALKYHKTSIEKNQF
uniref:Uncharacterized protein n=1 Tax=Oryza sativa subsp. japonica TaxID=39947 RepID=Q6H834_ORYSJ|nr:hypothetical protein [Oryza sativa Japonica Group]